MRVKHNKTYTFIYKYICIWYILIYLSIKTTYSLKALASDKVTALTWVIVRKKVFLALSSNKQIEFNYNKKYSEHIWLLWLFA